MTWKGVVGRPFTVEQFRTYVNSLRLGGWRPEFCVLHNTGIPSLTVQSLGRWHDVPGPARMRGLERYYRDDRGWSGGPHLFIADDVIWVFTPLTVPGVHAPSWNDVAWGVEMVGAYNSEPMNPHVLHLTLNALEILHTFGRLDPYTLKFHKEDPKTTHTVCPGKNVPAKLQIIQAIARLMVEQDGYSFRVQPLLKRGATGPHVARLQQLLEMTGLGSGVGVFGPKTEARLKEFQRAVGLDADGIVGPRTWAKLEGRE